MTMDRRERFRKCMAHVPDSEPMWDFAGSSLSGYMGTDTLIRVAEQLGVVGSDEAELKEGVQTALNVDFRGVGGFPQIESSYQKKISPVEYVDDFGIRRRFTGMYWDIVDSPLRGASLQDLSDYQFPDVSTVNHKQLEQFEVQAKHLYYDTDYIVVGEHPVLGVLELGCWMCGFDDFLCWLLAEPEFVTLFFEKYFEFQRQIIEVYYSRIGPYLHITTSGDDFGTQNGPFLSPDTFSEMIRPWYEKRIRLTKEYTDAYYSHHSCGSVYRLMQDISEMGVDILNPIQPDAFEMDFHMLKEHYGSQLTFWGGIDEQVVLTQGTPDDVRKFVEQACAVLGKDGGYIVAPSHNIQPDVPAENLIAMYDCVRRK